MAYGRTYHTAQEGCKTGKSGICGINICAKGRKYPGYIQYVKWTYQHCVSVSQYALRLVIFHLNAYDF
jgi:hypothetical protein